MNTYCKVCIGSLFVCLVLVASVTSVSVRQDVNGGTERSVKSSSRSKEINYNHKQSNPDSTRMKPQNNALEPPTSAQTPEGFLEPSDPVSIAEASTELKRVTTTESCRVKKSSRSFKWMLDECHITSSLSKNRQRKIVPDEETKRNILELYDGVFFTEESVLQLENARQNAEGKPGGRVQRSTEGNDGNICCPSVSVLEAAPSQMTNTYLQMRDIVHFAAEGLYQYINKGYCVSLTEQSCSGVCVPETRIIYLLVWKDPLPITNSSLPMTFEPFDIPSFCSCKNITP